MPPIWRLTGSSVNETSHDAYLIKSMHAFLIEGGCKHCHLLTQDRDKIDLFTFIVSEMIYSQWDKDDSSFKYMLVSGQLRQY